ncbi:MAG TPA: O-antigen polysaccharide polymerase Wzy, partial [Clostridiaceae bacterium]|nr:O-antigen polysaccharide polymerase Wzy [Clostridiaceae bacterium]
KNYLLGPFLDYYKNNAVGRLFDLDSEWYFAGNSEAKATEGNDFAHALSYVVMPERYVGGEGIGSSFVAEAYFMYGYVGVFFVSALIGLLILTLYNVKNIAALYFGFIIYDALIKAPRGPFGAIMLAAFDLNRLFIVAAVVVLALVLSRMTHAKDVV